LNNDNYDEKYQQDEINQNPNDNRLNMNNILQNKNNMNIYNNNFNNNYENNPNIKNYKRDYKEDFNYMKYKNKLNNVDDDYNINRPVLDSNQKYSCGP
jgi:hypothetical protein